MVEPRTTRDVGSSMCGRLDCSSTPAICFSRVVAEALGEDAALRNRGDGGCDCA